jgi:undecaprenyl-diphosphatase
LINVYQAATLGTLQGLTEFLPVSSSAHLRLVPWMLHWPRVDNEMAFDVALHLGTLIAVGLYFLMDWMLIVASYVGDLRQKRWLGGARGSLLLKIILATIPAAIVGKLFEKPIDSYFYDNEQHLWMLAVTLSVFGLFLLLSERWGKQNRTLTDVTFRDALIVGCAQALALVPGTSRSGVTILTALLLGLNRESAARFSFLLSTPIIAGAVILQLRKVIGANLAAGLPALHLDANMIVGVVAAAIVGMLAIRFLLKYVQTRSYAVFAYYRWVLAACVLAVYFTRM